MQTYFLIFTYSASEAASSIDNENRDSNDLTLKIVAQGLFRELMDWGHNPTGNNK